MFVRCVSGLAVVPIAASPPTVFRAADPLPRSTLILDQSDADSARRCCAWSFWTTTWARAAVETDPLPEASEGPPHPEVAGIPGGTFRMGPGQHGPEKGRSTGPATNSGSTTRRPPAGNRSSRRLRLGLIVSASLLVVGSLAWGQGDAAHAQERARRVLMLYPYSNLFPLSVITGEAARKRLNERSREPLELYTDFLDLGRFSGEAYETRTARYLVDKYHDRKPDVVMALGPQSLRFVLKNRHDLGFDAPIVFCCTSRARLATLNPPNDVIGIISEFDLVKTLALAQGLQPDASRIVVIAGATEFDQQWVEIARRQLAPYQQKYDTKYFVGLRHDDLMENLKRLPRDTIVILLTMFADSAGRLFIPPEIVQEVANTAAAPVYAPYETYLGRGIVGGYMDSLEQVGHEVADLALDILAGARPSSLVPRPTSGNAHRVDWRALKRWSLSESRLPARSEIRFREFSLWELYHWHMIAVALVLLFQATLITGLLIERHRRLAAEVESRRRLVELAHMNRTVAVGAMSASIAHELNQPLGAILSNAEAAELLLAANPLDLAPIKEILADIRQADERAGEIIAGLRGLMKRKEIERLEIELREVIANVVHLLEPEAKERNVEMSVDRVQPALFVRADRVHLQQVLLNLALNGMDAMRDCLPGRRRIAFETAMVGPSTVEVSVADTGTGIPTDQLKDVFEPLFTTKPHGTGLGLSIVRTIIDTYGGRIWAENRLDGGAVFRFSLPLASAKPA
jgi:signal transduction histidine kinase